MLMSDNKLFEIKKINLSKIYKESDRISGKLLGAMIDKLSEFEQAEEENRLIITRRDNE